MNDLMSYSEDDLVLLSGIQHFCFCRRQWALIHVEQQWQENISTTEGHFDHERCHDEVQFEKRNDLLITRGLRVVSYNLGVVGQCDVVEFKKTSSGALLQGHEGLWQPCPVEYKHGKSKSIDADRLQVCCQAMCLEEMLATEVPVGYLFYVETHRREAVTFSLELREQVRSMLLEMHVYLSRGYTPKVKAKYGCASCSMREICLPSLLVKNKVEAYYEQYLREVDS